jgi:hypothetical protein
MNEQKPELPPPPDSRRGALIGLGVVLLLVLGGIFLSHVLRKGAQLEDCVMQGRTNCVPIDEEGNGR